MSAHQLVGVVELRSAEQIHTDRVDQDAGGALLDNQILGVGRFGEFEFVLEAAASAGEDGDAKRRGPGLLGGNGGDTFGSAVGEGEVHNKIHSADGGRFKG